MLNKLTAIVLILSLVSVNCTRFLTFAGFELNKNYIAAKLCENRDRPWLHCNGKCYLLKKVKQAEQKEEKQERESQKNLFQEASVKNQNAIKFYTQVIQIIALPPQNNYLSQIGERIYHPPQTKC